MANDCILELRDKISKVWHENPSRSHSNEFFGFQTMDQYWAFCASKDWLQDTGEVLANHRQRGFSANSLESYLEFWGVLQAIVVQQDAIREMNYAFSGVRTLNPEIEPGSSWSKIRKLRNLAVGHPTARGVPSKNPNSVPNERCVVGRQPKSYDAIDITRYKNSSVSHETINLGMLIATFNEEAEPYMRSFCFRLLEQLGL